MLLTKAEVARAAAYHRAHPRLVEGIPPGLLRGAYATPEWVESVAAFQAAHGLAVDGIVGARETLPALRSSVETVVAGIPHDAVLVGPGRWFRISGVRVVNPLSPEGYDFGRHQGHTHGPFASGAPRSIAIHDSVTRTTEACFRALLEAKRRKTGKIAGYGTHFMLSPSGTLYQCTRSLQVVTWHAAGWNEEALGFDVICLLDPALAPKHPLRRPPTSWAPEGYIDYTPEQKALLPLVMRVLCRELKMLFDCPRRPDGHPDLRAYGDQVPGLDPKTFRGVVGHGQTIKARWDGNRALGVIFDAAA